MDGADDLRFSHVGIHVHDIAAMEHFYVDLLGFTVTDRGELSRGGKTMKLVFLSRDPQEHHQIALVSGRPFPLGYNVVNQLSLRVGSLAVLKGLYRRCIARHVSEIHPVNHINAVSLYANDPEGNRIELFWDTPWHVPQPLALPIDLGESDERLLEWMEAYARSSAGFLPKAEWVRQMAERMEATQRRRMLSDRNG
jgi:catechol 2,3-dioxygenase-like lactoylglutathione lyase family enzyme